DDGTPVFTTATPFGATFWVVKNAGEVKCGQNIQIDSNIFENHWSGGGGGFALWLKSDNQDGSAPYCQSRDITVEKNLFRHVDGFLLAVGQEFYTTNGADAPAPMTNLTVKNNLVYDSNTTYVDGCG